MSDFAFKNLKARVRRNVGLIVRYVEVGDELGNIFHPYLPNYVWVREVYANGYGSAFPALGPAGTSIVLQPGTRVTLANTPDGKIQITGYDVVGGTIDGNNIMQANVPQLGSGTFIGQQSIATVLVTPQGIPDLTVIVKSWLVVVNGILYIFAGNNSLSLSGSVPASGNNCYAVVFLDNDFASTRVTASTARSIADVPLGQADIQECLDGAPVTSIPLAVVRLYGGQTTIQNADIVHDTRQIVNVPPNDMTQATAKANATVASTAAETTLVGTLVGTNAFAAAALSRVGRQVRVSAWGYVSDTGTPTLQLKLKLGSTVVLDTTAITLGAGISNKLWRFEGTFTIQTSGASGKLFAQGQWYQNGVTTDIVNTAQTSIDLTVALTLDLTATWGASNPSNTITCSNLSVEVLN